MLWSRTAVSYLLAVGKRDVLRDDLERTSALKSSQVFQHCSLVIPGQNNMGVPSFCG